VLSGYVHSIEVACEQFAAGLSSSATHGTPVAMFQPLRRFLIEQPLRNILGLGDAAPGLVMIIMAVVLCRGTLLT